MKKKKDAMTAKKLGRHFDGGNDIGKYLDWSKATRPGAGTAESEGGFTRADH